MTQAQFGVSFGGPVVRNRTFFFGNVERTRQEKNGVVTIPPASVDAINDVLRAAEYAGPLAETGEFVTGYTSTNVFGRVDHQMSTTQQLLFRYGWNHRSDPSIDRLVALGEAQADHVAGRIVFREG